MFSFGTHIQLGASGLPLVSNHCGALLHLLLSKKNENIKRLGHLHTTGLRLMLQIPTKLSRVSSRHFTQESLSARSLTQGLRCSEDSVAFHCSSAAMELFPNFICIIRGVSGITATQNNMEVACTQLSRVMSTQMTSKQTIKQLFLLQ